MRNFLFSIAAVSVFAMGCVSATITEPSICDSQTLTQLPSVPAGVTVPSGLSVPPVSFSQTTNVSDTIKKITDVADNVNVEVTKLSLTNTSGNMSWLQHVEVDVESVDDPTSYPSSLVTKYDLLSSDENSSSVSLSSQMDANKLFQYLQSGEVRFTFTLSGNLPQKVPTLSGTVCLAADASISKGL